MQLKFCLFISDNNRLEVKISMFTHSLVLNSQLLLSANGRGNNTLHFLITAFDHSFISYLFLIVFGSQLLYVVSNIIDVLQCLIALFEHSIIHY